MEVLRRYAICTVWRAWLSLMVPLIMDEMETPRGAGAGNPKPEIRKKAETRNPNPNCRLQHFPTSGGTGCPLNTPKDAKRDTDFTNFHGWIPEFIFVSFFSVFSGHPVLLSDYFFRL